MAKIVVGVDGSPSSLRALEFAAHQARSNRAKLEIVCVYTAASLGAPLFVPSEHGAPGYVNPPIVEDAEAAWLRDRSDVGDAYRLRAEETIDRLVDHLGDKVAGLEIERLAIANRHPASVLLEEAEDADLLVVGRRGRGGFEALLLGSVSRACVDHARCPVVVMPAGH